MATDGTERLLYRVTRDLQAPMALLVALHPRRAVIAHRGFNNGGFETLLAIDSAEVRSCGKSPAGTAIRSWAAASVSTNGIEVGTLFVADRRRRWFDDEEVRHLGLLGCSAGTIIVGLLSTSATSTRIDVADRSVDLREQRIDVVSAPSG